MDTKRSEAIMNLAAALAVAQGQIETASKDNVAKVKMSTGGEFSYKYSTLDDIWAVARTPLSENGLSVIQIPTNDSDGFSLETILIHSSGEWISGTMILPVIAGRMSELQAMGSAITYARRYMLGAMVGITTGDDDDGQVAANSQKTTQNATQHMSPGQLLSKLNKIARIKGFYRSVDDILEAVYKEETDWPPSDDLDGWRSLFADARDYAIENLESVDDSPPDSPPGGETQTETSDWPDADTYKTEAEATRHAELAAQERQRQEAKAQMSEEEKESRAQEVKTATETMRNNGDDDPLGEQIPPPKNMAASTLFWKYVNAQNIDRDFAGEFIQKANSDFAKALELLKQAQNAS